MRTPHGYPEILEMFGNPSGQDGTLNPVWEAKNIVLVKPPSWKLYYQADNAVLPMSGLRVHRAIEASLLNVLREVWKYTRTQVGAEATDDATRLWLRQNRLDLIGGAFNFRRKRSASSELSLHSWGIALDWDPAQNPMKRPLTHTLPDWWYDIWKANGWRDGRGFPTPDPMHVQFATGA